MQIDYRKYQTLPNELIYDKTKEKKDIKSYDNDNNDNNNNNNIKLSKSSPYSQLNHIKKWEVHKIKQLKNNLKKSAKYLLSSKLFYINIKFKFINYIFIFNAIVK